MAVLLLLVSGCAHMGAANSTFSHSDAALVLKVQRHVDEILHGPDFEEDQTLVLELKDYVPGERLMVPSAKATAKFDVDRSGPASHGDEFSGYVIVGEMGETRIKAEVNLTVKARTNDGSYTQQAKFSGTYVFNRADHP